MALTAVSPPSPPPPDEALWCRTTRALREDEAVCAFVVAEPPAIPNHHAVKAEPGESPYPAALHSDIQLLPQQAGMAAILATAVVNSESSGTESMGRDTHTHTHTRCSPRGRDRARVPQPVTQAICVPSSPQRTSFRAKTAGSGTGASATCKPT